MQVSQSCAYVGAVLAALVHGWLRALDVRSSSAAFEVFAKHPCCSCSPVARCAVQCTILCCMEQWLLYTCENAARAFRDAKHTE